MSPIGLTADESWESLLAGRSGIEFAPDYAERQFRSQVHGSIKIDITLQNSNFFARLFTDFLTHPVHTDINDTGPRFYPLRFDQTGYTGRNDENIGTLAMGC